MMRLGTALDGDDVEFDPYRRHTLVTGMNGSGKSSTACLLVAQALATQRVRVVGIDIERILLRPFQRDDLIATGTGVKSLESGLTVLEAAVAEIERRIDQLPPHSDGLTVPTPEVPAWLVTLEELQVLGERYKALGRAEYAKFSAAMNTILVQGRKALVNCLAITQRPLSDVVPGRSQFGRLIIHRMQQRKDVSLVWDGLDPMLQDRLSVARPGQAVVIDGGEPRFCAIDYASYSRYVDRVNYLREVK
ncbi:FtsK/SpoIIIE domain-containing protein [Gordonia sp. i37]|uniref:FtsK/SpoIIIE domain-containing protein n=1 Tax=Gordonia sp. i37 TaxID=1961707 RepID=UPI00111BA764|nr:FtsK/SpoIIIE domain-containing protein [Gordonia sp. i37]